MKTRLAIVLAVLFIAAPVFAHRLDEYLQAAILSVEKDHLEASLRLVPGVAVSSTVIASIDSNRDGIISSAEGQAYAQQVLRDLSVSVDGHPVVPRLLSENFPTIEEMKAGTGEIQIEFRAELPHGGVNREIILENHHQSRIAAYLVNCLEPRDPDVRVVAQHRNENQSFYRLLFTHAGGDSVPWFSGWWSGIALSTNVGFASLFRLGMRHIAEGTDHLLFLLALLLPAPLVAVRQRWNGSASIRGSLLSISKVVTAFTIGHSITLALAALGIMRAPARPIEVLIAVSIFVSAVHAIRPLFPGREAAIAAFFGLIHGLAFATTLGQLGLGRWQRVAGTLGFNLGIETVQFIVVAATLPSLLLLSRTRGYPFFRIGGALFAGFAAVGWMAERVFDVSFSVDTVVNLVAHRSTWIASILFLMSLVSWSSSRLLEKRTRAARLPRLRGPRWTDEVVARFPSGMKRVTDE